MNKKFRCGRLVVRKDGRVKKLELVDGGGTRDCILTHIDAGFDEIHDRLRELFTLNPTNRTSKLYDFQLNELDTGRYQNFLEYVTKNGLKFNGTLLYLCTPEDDDVNFKSPAKRTTPIQIQPQVVRRIPQVEADSSTSPILTKIHGDSHHNRKSTNESIHNNRTIDNHRTLLFTPYRNYSFKKSLINLIDYLRDTIIPLNHDNIFIQLLENISTMYGLSLIHVDQLKHQFQNQDEHKKPIYDFILQRIHTLSESIKKLTELNQIKISHIDQQSIIIYSLDEFRQNFKILFDRWFNKDSSYNQRTSLSSTNHSVDSTSHSSSSYRHHSERTSRKQTRPLSPPSHRITTDEDNRENYPLFKDILKSLNDLLNILDQRRFFSFYHYVEDMVKDIKSCRSTINVSEYQTLSDSERIITSIEKRLTRRINDEYNQASPYGINQQIENSFNRTLDSIKTILTSIDYYKRQIDENQRSKKIRWSSPEPSAPMKQEHSEHKPKVKLDPDLITIDEESNSEVSHSSYGDEVLMEVARNAYEKGPSSSKRSK